MCTHDAKNISRSKIKIKSEALKVKYDDKTVIQFLLPIILLKNNEKMSEHGDHPLSEKTGSGIKSSISIISV